MKEQIESAILPELPIVGSLKLSSLDGKSLRKIEVIAKGGPTALTPFFEDCFYKLLSFLEGNNQRIEIPLDHSELSAFQKRVLQEMAKIPYGQTATYRDLARKMESKGYQAIGSACGRNPFLLIYPCHRILGSKDLGGFAHGPKMKRELLVLEGIKL
jgi:O-6-methylguanine DNA methyltransferase